MTSSKNTNDPRRDDELTSESLKNNQKQNNRNFDDDWSSFIAEHSDDMNDIANSRSAKSFEKHAQKEEKKKNHNSIASDNNSKNQKNAIKNKFSLNNLSSHKSYIIPTRMQDPHTIITAKGPRDNTRTSWLDLDKTMEDYGDDFVPPNPQFYNVSLVNVVLWILFVIGIFGVIISAFIPAIANIVGIICGLLTLLSGAGLLMNRKKPDPYKEDYSDYGDGARV
ncbi:hypothetical protein ACMZ7F_06115 [Gardnerella swidsinskii]|uniref:hypothetical protein n=1 Tax=Gardnerella swidsinskii TaxID=2792979 RepID=UPI0039EFF854